MGKVKVFIIAGLMLAIFAYGQGIAVAADEIKVGAVINLTGPASTWGQFHAKGGKDYFRYVNEVKGGVGGRRPDSGTSCACLLNNEPISIRHVPYLPKLSGS